MLCVLRGVTDNCLTNVVTGNITAFSTAFVGIPEKALKSHCLGSCYLPQDVGGWLMNRRREGNANLDK